MEGYIVKAGDDPIISSNARTNKKQGSQMPRINEKDKPENISSSEQVKISDSRPLKSSSKTEQVREINVPRLSASDDLLIRKFTKATQLYSDLYALLAVHYADHPEFGRKPIEQLVELLGINKDSSASDEELRKRIKHSGLYLEWQRITSIPKSEQEEYLDVIMHNINQYIESAVTQASTVTELRGRIEELESLTRIYKDNVRASIMLDLKERLEFLRSERIRLAQLRGQGGEK